MKLGPKKTPGTKGESYDDAPRLPDFITTPASCEDLPGHKTDDLKAMIVVALDEDVRPIATNPLLDKRLSPLSPNDYESLPSNSTELHDPFKTAVLMQLKMYLLRLSSSGVLIDANEKEALVSIKKRLESLSGDCAKNEMQDWVPIIGRHLRIINAILERKN